MKFIKKEEVWNWQPSSVAKYADGEIPDELHTKLVDAITNYMDVCEQINQYLEDHPDNYFYL
jgi:hypothetical protein